MTETTLSLNNWDPLFLGGELSEEIIAAGKKREIKNILKSYTGWYDPLSELIQNALDSVDKRAESGEKDYVPQIWITVNLKENSISITDNGLGFNEIEFKNFLKPNISFKGGMTRGNKGVGATYLAYGFNFLQAGTKRQEFSYCGELKNGRVWVEDEKGIVTRPSMQISKPVHAPFNLIDKGSTFTLKFIGNFIRPSDLKWISATNASQWDFALRINTPLGGVYLEKEVTKTICHLEVIEESGKASTKDINPCKYVYPHEVISACVDLKDIIKKQQELASSGKILRLPSNFYNLNGIYSVWNSENIIEKKGSLKPNLTSEQKELLKKYGAKVYGFFCYSTKVWDEFNDNILKLRKGGRILCGGLQLATNCMPQGGLLTIPLTSNIGYQKQSHVIIHFDSADPDLGRKGFQPELKELAENISASVVNLLKGWRMNLKKDSGAPPNILEDSRVDNWIKAQVDYEEKNPLIISNKEFFIPIRESSITSKPNCEQDVIVLFNQLIAGGVIRGLKIMATSGNEQYDGIYRVWLKKPFDNHLFDKEKNPLGIEKRALSEEFVSKPYILEYKYDFDSLISDFENEEKTEKNINLVVVWKIGDEWKKRYSINPLLHFNNVHNRIFHGATHDVRDISTGEHVFYIIALSELIDYINNPDGVQQYQEKTYLEE